MALNVNLPSGEAGMKPFRKHLPRRVLVCAVGSLSYPLREGFEISLANATFSDGDALKIDYFFLAGSTTFLLGLFM